MYAELKCKSNFSFLRGASDSRDYLARASELVMPAIAITDLNGVYGIPRAWELARDLKNLKLIVGAELTLSDHPNITLLARDRGAYAVMCKTITKLHAGKEKGEGQISLAELLESMNGDKRSSGLVALPDFKKLTNVGALKEVFGARLFLPLCKYLDGLDRERTEKTMEASQYYSVPIVAHNDVHYHVQSRKLLQDTLASIREGVTLKTGGKKLFSNAERYLKSPLQMRALFKDMPEAIRATLDIAEGCTFKLSELSYQYPAELIPAQHTPQSYLEELVLKGAQRIYRGVISSAVDDRIQKEFRMIEKKGYAAYFLTISDIVDFATKNEIICQGRGSAANSMVCYCLGVTAIDPVRMNLLFERFISDGRNEPPDIDVDFEHERREEVIQYIYRRFGRDRAAMVSAVRTYQKKSSLLEVSKAFGIPVGTISANALVRDFDQIAGSLVGQRPIIEGLVEELADFPRHLSIHSGGFTLSDGPIDEIVPIEPARMPGRTIIQWDKYDLATIGLLKLDILSIGFLTVISKASRLLKKHWHDFPPECPKTYAMISKGMTIGTFQIESRAQISMLPRTKPQTHYDLVLQVAVVRPGPNVGHMVRPMLQRREDARRGKPYQMPDKRLEHILGRTYGVPLFQEQVMAIALEFGGFTDSEADALRRSIARERSVESVDAIGKKLHEGLIKNGIPNFWIEELSGYFRGFSAYGFPESHSQSYALIAYVSAYLKCHHPAELLCALINSQPMGFYSIHTLINDAKRSGGVRVLPINVNLSSWDAVMEGNNTVRMGFRNVRTIREEDVRWMSEENDREIKESDTAFEGHTHELHESFLVLESERKKGHFSSLFDFMMRTHFSKETIKAMAMADVFSSFGQDRRHSYWDSISHHSLFEKSEAAQLSLFSTDPTPVRQTQIFKPLTLIESITADYEALGYSVDGNIMVAFRKVMENLPPLTSVEVRQLKNGQLVHFAGVLNTLQRPPTAFGTAYATLEDNDGSVDLTIKKEVFEKYADVIKNNIFLEIKGIAQFKGDSFFVLMTDVRPFINQDNPKSISHGATSRTYGAPLL